MGTTGKQAQTNGTEESNISGEMVSILSICLKEVGDYGEVHLIVKGGQVRFIRSVRSMTIRQGNHPMHRSTEPPLGV